MPKESQGWVASIHRAAEKEGVLGKLELPALESLGNTQGQRGRREGRSLKSVNGLGPPQVRRKRWVACGPSFYLFLALPSEVAVKRARLSVSIIRYLVV